jgi:SAM-dependent methyltransferase
VAEPSKFYKSFSEKKLTTYGSARRGKIEQHRLALLHRHRPPPGDLYEIGPGHGTLAEQAVEAGWRYTADVVYADQVLEHMNGIESARHFTAEALRALRRGGIFFVVVPDYLKERTFFWDVDYTHNFVTTERRVRQLFNDGGFDILYVERGIGLATGVARDALAAGALLVNLPGVDALSRYTHTEELLFKIRKNLFETLTFVARKPS